MTNSPPAPASRFIRYPALWPAVAFAIGILAAHFAPIDLSILLSGAAISAAAAFILSGKYRQILVLFTFLIAGAGTYSYEQRPIGSDRLKLLYDNATLESGSLVEIEGILVSKPEASIDGAFITLDATTVRSSGIERPVSGKVRIFVPERNNSDLIADGSYETSDPQLVVSDLKYGSRIRIPCSVEREERYQDPGVVSRLELLDHAGIDATCSVKSSLLIEHIADESVFLPLAWVYDQRANLIHAFRHNLTPRAAGVMIASLLGNKFFLDKDTADLFRDGGTFHILVISGLHITFIGVLLQLLMRRLSRNRWTQFGVTVCILWAYALAVGADVPVVRAAIMFTTVLIGYAIHRQSALVNSMAVCALILLGCRPSDLFDPSFQLTFVSVAAIVAVAYPLVEHLRSIGDWAPSPGRPFPPNVSPWLKRLCETFYWSDDAWLVESRRQIWSARVFKSPWVPHRLKDAVQKAVRYVFEALLVSLIVEIAMLPLSVVYFHRVSLASVLLNIWVSAWIAVESFAAVAGVLCAQISSSLAFGLFAIADAANWVMLLVPRLFSDNGWASFRLPAYASAARAIYLVYFVPLAIIALAIARWNPFALIREGSNQIKLVIGAALCLMLLIGLVVTHPFSVARPDGRLHIDFLDVGQGDSALVTFPDGQTLLVDGGGQVGYRASDPDAEPIEKDVRGIGESVVSEVLWAKGYSRIDHILATHGDADHIQGLNDVAKNFSIGSAIFGRTPPADPEYAQLAEVLTTRRIPIETVARGDVLKFGNATAEVLYPVYSDDPNAVSDNDHSVVVRIVYGTRSFLLTGDIERQAETDLINGGGTLTADIVKVAHHGSRTSSTPDFLAATHPSWAVISVGKHSPFGHPHPEVVDRWLASGAHVLTTGTDGMITVSTDGHDLLVMRYAAGKIPDVSGDGF